MSDRNHPCVNTNKNTCKRVLWIFSYPVITYYTFCFLIKANGQTYRQTYRQTDRQKDRKTDRQTDGKIGKQTDRQTNGQKDRQADRQTDRRPNRQTDRKTDRRTRRQIPYRHRYSHKKEEDTLLNNKYFLIMLRMTVVFSRLTLRSEDVIYCYKEMLYLSYNSHFFYRPVPKEARISVMYSVHRIMEEIYLSMAKEQNGCHIVEVLY